MTEVKAVVTTTIRLRRPFDRATTTRRPTSRPGLLHCGLIKFSYLTFFNLPRPGTAATATTTITATA